MVTQQGRAGYRRARPEFVLDDDFSPRLDHDRSSWLSRARLPLFGGAALSPCATLRLHLRSARCLDTVAAMSRGVRARASFVPPGPRRRTRGDDPRGLVLLQTRDARARTHVPSFAMRADDLRRRARAALFDDAQLRARTAAASAVPVVADPGLTANLALLSSFSGSPAFHASRSWTRELGVDPPPTPPPVLTYAALAARVVASRGSSATKARRRPGRPRRRVSRTRGGSRRPPSAARPWRRRPQPQHPPRRPRDGAHTQRQRCDRHPRATRATRASSAKFSESKRTRKRRPSVAVGHSDSAIASSRPVRWMPDLPGRGDAIQPSAPLYRPSSSVFDFEWNADAMRGIDAQTFDTFDAPAPQAIFDSDAHMYYTSGTTGAPKGVTLSHAIVGTHAVAVTAEMRLCSHDVRLHAAPMFHLVDAFATYACMRGRGRHVTTPTFNADIALAADRTRTRHRHEPRVDDGGDDDAQPRGAPSRISRRFACCRAGMPAGAPRARRAVALFGCEFFLSYGMTECCGKIAVVDALRRDATRRQSRRTTRSRVHVRSTVLARRRSRDAPDGGSRGFRGGARRRSIGRGWRSFDSRSDGFRRVLAPPRRGRRVLRRGRLVQHGRPRDGSNRRVRRSRRSEEG